MDYNFKVLSNTYKTINYVNKLLLNYPKKEVVLNIFGYNQVMYSKRELLSNFNRHFNLKNTYNNEIKDQNSNTKFKIVERDGETVVLSNHIFDGRRLLALDNVKYYYLNTSFIDLNTTINFILGKEIENSDEGFLDKASYYKLEEVKK